MLEVFKHWIIDNYKLGYAICHITNHDNMDYLIINNDSVVIELWIRNEVVYYHFVCGSNDYSTKSSNLNDPNLFKELRLFFDNIKRP